MCSTTVCRALKMCPSGVCRVLKMCPSAVCRVKLGPGSLQHILYKLQAPRSLSRRLFRVLFTHPNIGILRLLFAHPKICLFHVLFTHPNIGICVQFPHSKSCPKQWPPPLTPRPHKYCPLLCPLSCPNTSVNSSPKYWHKYGPSSVYSPSPKYWPSPRPTHLFFALYSPPQPTTPVGTVHPPSPLSQPVSHTHKQWKNMNHFLFVFVNDKQ